MVSRFSAKSAGLDLDETDDETSRSQSMADTNRDAEFPRVVIEQVTPALDGGRYAIKRAAGSVVDVGAAIFKDGHDLIAADLVYQGPDDREPRRTPLTYRFDPDRWYASFRADVVGTFRYWIEAWPDDFGTFRYELGKRVDAGQDVRPELLEGAAILERHDARLSGEALRRLSDAALKLSEASRPLEDRLRVAFAEDILELARHSPDIATMTRTRVREIMVDREEGSFSAWYE